MVKRKKVATKPVDVEEPQPTKEEPIVTNVTPIPTPIIEELILELQRLIAELEADPLVPMDCEYPREYGEKIFPRYQKFLAALKKLVQ